MFSMRNNSRGLFPPTWHYSWWPDWIRCWWQAICPPGSGGFLRKIKKQVNSNKPKYCNLTAVDPLNFLNLNFPNRQLARLSKNRALYENGIPIALLESSKVTFSERNWSHPRMEIAAGIDQEEFSSKTANLPRRSLAVRKIISSLKRKSRYHWTR